MTTDEQIKFEYAKKRVEELKKFYRNLITYILVMIFLAVLNYNQNKWENAWFIWPLLGWGMGIAFHAIKAFQINPTFNKEWEARKMREFMEKDTQEMERWE